MRRIFRFIGIGVLTGAMSACAFNVEPFLSKEITGSDFNTYLAREYQRRTDTEVNVDVQWVHASRLAAKGESALAGKQVLPWAASDWNVDGDNIADLDSAREKLLKRLERGREATPEACARAQVYYDGWLEQSHGGQAGGSNNSAQKWEQNFNGLAETFRVIALDRLAQAGTQNLSRREDYADYFKRDADHLEAFIDALGLHSVTLVGHSQGGWPITRVALNRPELVQCLVNVDTVMVPDDRELMREALSFLIYMFRAFEMRQI